MNLQQLDRSLLEAWLVDAAKNWLAHDGLWFLEVEKAHGMDHAITLDANAWRQFTVIEARRIMDRLGLKPGGGMKALAQALDHRLYALLNTQSITHLSEDRLVFTMNNCRVQSARTKRNLPDFPCKQVGVIEYGFFASAIDPRIKTRCLFCPPDKHPADAYCSWEFTFEGQDSAQ